MSLSSGDDYRNVYEFDKIQQIHIVDQRKLEVKDYQGKYHSVVFERQLDEGQEEWSEWKMFVGKTQTYGNEKISLMEQCRKNGADMYDLKDVIRVLNTNYIGYAKRMGFR